MTTCTLGSLGTWDRVGLVLGAAGLAVSLYLTANAFFPTLSIVCPSGGIINCEEVTSSQFSHIFRIVPVALLGLLWFVAVVLLMVWKPRSYPYALILLWVAAMVMVGYLVYIEVAVLHAICPYCTAAHVCAALLGIPILKLALREI